MECQFPTHVDFQKLGEVTFNNEVYKVLKPQQHIVQESKDVLRRENNFPKEGILIDTSGRIHYWRGLMDSSNKSELDNYNNSKNVLKSIFENYRGQSNIKMDDAKDLNADEGNNYHKYDIKLLDDIIQRALDVKDAVKGVQYVTTTTASDLKPIVGDKEEDTSSVHTEKNNSVTDKNSNDTEEKSEENTTMKSMDENDEKLNETENFNGAIQNDSKDEINVDENIDNDPQAETENIDYESTTDIPEVDTTTTTKARKRKEKKVIIPPNTVYVPRPLRGGKGKTVVKTTFFCPFLGIITMSSLIDV